MVKHLLYAIIMLAPASAAAQQVAPWSEAVVSVTDIAATTRLLREAGGWTATHKGKIARAELDYWKLPKQAAANFERLCAPGTGTGCIRFIRFTGVEQRPIRLATRAWDNGGIFSIMVRSDNVPALFDQAIKMGWWAESEPVRFTFGSSDLRNVVLTGPHGINIAVYERVSPAFTAFPVGRMSQAFNSMRMVKSRTAARDFYKDKLGFSVLFDSANEPIEPARSNFGIPLNYTPQIKRAAAALQPLPGETGRVEVMQIDGFTGSDVSSFASPPNLGIISVRYPVQDLAAYRAQLQQRGVTIAYEATQVKIGGLGTTDIFAVRDPDGNITEFYELHGKGN
jgi:catechol 2,3-dioxygenase-like lactoylglutathione lyase family enzyme